MSLIEESFSSLPSYVSVLWGSEVSNLWLLKHCSCSTGMSPFVVMIRKALDVLLVNRVYAMNHTNEVLVCGVTAIYLYGALVLERN